MKFTGITLVMAILSTHGCAPDNEPLATCEGGRGADVEEFSDLYGSLNGEFSDTEKEPVFNTLSCDDNPKADGFGFLPDPCELLEPLLPFGDDALRLGFFLGIEGAGILGPAIAFGGYDIVWDFYGQQMTVSQYAGGGLGVPGVGASALAYTGLAFGFERGVTEWNGYFVTASTEVSLPLLKDYVSLNPAVFVSAYDNDNNGIITPDEAVAPPDDIYGFAIGVSAGFDFLPSISPIGGQIVEGFWEPHKAAIRHFYDDFRDTKMFFTTPMEVSLVDAFTGEVCDDQWPQVNSEQNCVIEFGDKQDTYLERAVNTAYSVCHVAGRCVVPLSWKMSTLALAIAALRDNDANFSNLCN